MSTKIEFLEKILFHGMEKEFYPNCNHDYSSGH